MDLEEKQQEISDSIDEIIQENYLEPLYGVKAVLTNEEWQKGSISNNVARVFYKPQNLRARVFTRAIVDSAESAEFTKFPKENKIKTGPTQVSDSEGHDGCEKSSEATVQEEIKTIDVSAVLDECKTVDDAAVQEENKSADEVIVQEESVKVDEKAVQDNIEDGYGRIDDSKVQEETVDGSALQEECKTFDEATVQEEIEKVDEKAVQDNIEDGYGKTDDSAVQEECKTSDDSAVQEECKTVDDSAIQDDVENLPDQTA